MGLSHLQSFVFDNNNNVWCLSLFGLMYKRKVRCNYEPYCSKRNSFLTLFESSKNHGMKVTAGSDHMRNDAPFVDAQPLTLFLNRKDMEDSSKFEHNKFSS